MADQVYQPIVSDEDDQTETPPASTELPIESWSDYRASLEEGADKSDLTTEEAASQCRRRPDPESPESAYERPITVHKVKGDGPLGLNEAVDDLRFSRAQKLSRELIEAGLSERQLDEMAAETIARGERIEPLAPPPPEVKGLDEFGREDDGPLSVDEAAKQLTDWRQRHAEAQQAELQELVGEAVQERQAEAQQAQQSQPEPQQQQPQAPDPVQTERQQLAQERYVDERAAACIGVPRGSVEASIIHRAGGCKCAEFRVVQKRITDEEALARKQQADHAL
jgi:hypothetical protein